MRTKLTDKEIFNNLVERAIQVDSHAHMRPVIEKELLHYDILFVLDQHNLLDQLTFQGGTSLRLCYGADRFSEDLDFAGGKNFAANDLKNMKTCLEKYMGDRYGLEVNVKEPKMIQTDALNNNIRVDKWQLSITTSPERKDLPKQKIKIEVANIPSYSREPRALQHNYDFLPDGYSDTLVMTETLDEIMADKLVSFVSCIRHIRYRDIWDLRWLKQQGAKINQQYIQSKILDYKITDYNQNLDTTLQNLSNIIHGKEFHNEMSRFIPMDVQARTLKKDKFLEFLNSEIKILLSEVKNPQQP